MTSFGGAKDSGRDATFTGEAGFPSEKTRWDGYWVFQVKYVDFEEQGVRWARTALQSTFRAEVRKILRRDGSPAGDKGTPDNYILITNVPLTGHNRDNLEATLVEAGFRGHYAFMDGKDVCQWLDLVPQVRRSYPQLLGLADLESILNRELYVRSEAYVQQWQPCLATFVRTEAYNEALATLRQHHFVVLDGPPEAGKSTIAAAVALLYAADGFELVDLRGPDQLFKVYGRDRSQLFVADDAVGSVSFDPSLSDNWSRDLPGILRKLDTRHLLVWTARRYVLEEAIAKSRLGEAIRDFPGIHEVLVEVGQLPLQEKAAILYNHAKIANMSEASRALIRENAGKIANHPNFTPERIRQLCQFVLPGQSDATDKGSRELGWDQLQEFLNNPGKRWVQAYSGLGASAQTLLLCMLDFDGMVKIEKVRSAYQQRSTQIDGKALPFDEVVKRLQHSFLRVVRFYSQHEAVDFQHPSLRDMLLSRLRDDETARRRYVELASPVALATLIQGVVLSLRQGELREHDEHILVLKEEELSVLVQRIAQVCGGPLPADDWSAILSAADLLLPRASERARIPPAEADLVSFNASPQGRLLQAVVGAFASAKTLDANRRYALGAWASLLKKCYDLVIYLTPPPHVDIAPRLARRLTTAAPSDAIPLATVIQATEPIVIRQAVSAGVLQSWDQYLTDEVAQSVKTGEQFPDWDDPWYDPDNYYDYEHEYATWESNADEVLTTADGFYRWALLEAPQQLENLRALTRDLVPPPEPDLEAHDDDRADRFREEYWTIERMFHDL